MLVRVITKRERQKHAMVHGASVDGYSVTVSRTFLSQKADEEDLAINEEGIDASTTGQELGAELTHI